MILEVYQAALFWNGEERDVEILAMEGAPLIGMTLLEDSDVRFQGREGGLVSIEALLVGVEQKHIICSKTNSRRIRRQSKERH